MSDDFILPERIKKRLYKLLELSKRGIGGERENAESRLEALLKRQGIKKEDFLEKEDVQEFFFTFNNKFEKRLFIQIAFSVQAEKVYSYPGSKRLSVQCTVAQHAEIKIKYSVYRRALEDEFDLTFEAFVHSQRIYKPSVENDNEETQETVLSREEQRRIKLIANRAMMMDRVNVHAGIERK